MEIQKTFRIYNDEFTSKGNLFEENINCINKLRLGYGIKISNSPFIYKDGKDKKTYLSANYIDFKFGEKDSKSIYYPISFCYQVFQYKNYLSYLSQSNKLILFEFKEKEKEKVKEITIYTIPNIKDKKAKLEILSGKMTEDEIQLSEKAKGLNEIRDLNKVYEELINILSGLAKGRNLPFFAENTKKVIGKTEFILNTDTLHIQCTIDNIFYQVDEAGIIREPIKLEKGTIDFDKGIKNLYDYVKKEDTDAKNKLANNTFRSPIIYKNFDDDIIPSDKIIICEIKSGFDLNSVKDQIEERIKLLNNCLIANDEKPEYFIGIVNLLSQNVEKINVFSGLKFEEKEKILMVATVDYIYWGIDVSGEISSDYLLHKEIKNLGDKLEKKIDDKYNQLDQKIDAQFNQLNQKFDLLIYAMQSYHPDIA